MTTAAPALSKRPALGRRQPSNRLDGLTAQPILVFGMLDAKSALSRGKKAAFTLAECSA
jgi:hypothetical protein